MISRVLSWLLSTSFVTHILVKLYWITTYCKQEGCIASGMDPDIFSEIYVDDLIVNEKIVKRSENCGYHS